MATQTDLFLAILALDAYNRGDNPGMKLPDSAPTGQTGDATILTTLTDDATSERSPDERSDIRVFLLLRFPHIAALMRATCSLLESP